MSQLDFLFGKKFKGGPDFRLNRTYNYDLDGIDLEVTVPDSNIQSASGEAVSQFPFRRPGWFDEHCQQLSNHFYVTLGAGGSWAYVGPTWKVGKEPLGTLDLFVWIKRTLLGHTLKQGDMDCLAAAIRSDYEEYFNAEEPGDYGRGKNRQRLRDAAEKYDKPYMLNDPDMQRRKQLFIQKGSRELPQKFDVREYGTQRWLHYTLEREPNYPTHHYCQALDEHFYLDIFFHYGLDFRDYFHYWKDHAEAAEQRMIQAIRLNFPDRVETDLIQR